MAILVPYVTVSGQIAIRWLLWIYFQCSNAHVLQLIYFWELVAYLSHLCPAEHFLIFFAWMTHVRPDYESRPFLRSAVLIRILLSTSFERKLNAQECSPRGSEEPHPINEFWGRSPRNAHARFVTISSIFDHLFRLVYVTPATCIRLRESFAS